MQEGYFLPVFRSDRVTKQKNSTQPSIFHPSHQELLPIGFWGTKKPFVFHKSDLPVLNEFSLKKIHGDSCMT